MARRYVPARGDVIWITFNPQAGYEQAGRRPALVLSPVAYNRKVGLAVMCPITNQIKGYPFEVVITENPPSVVLADQVKSVDWRARAAVRKWRVSEAILEEVRAKIRALIGA